MTILADTDRKARKRHTCCWCLGPIEPGATYREVRGVWDGYMSTQRCHWPCETLVRNYSRDIGLYDDEAPDWGELMLWAREEGIELPEYLR